LSEKTVVAHSVNPYLPASGSWIYSQLVNMKRYRPIVLTKRKENLDSFPFEPVYAQYDLPLIRRGYEKLYKKLTRTYFPSYKRVLIKTGAPLLHSHFCNYGMEDVTLKRVLDIGHVTTFYGSDIWFSSTDPGWRKHFREFAQESDMFLVEGGAMREKVLSLGAPDEKVRIFHLGIQLDKVAFRERGIGEGGKVNIMMAGRAIEKKGHLLGLMAFERLCRKYPSIHLVMIVGGKSVKSDEIKKRMQGFIRDKGISERVTWNEFMPYDKYLEMLRNVHVFLQPSVHASDGDAEGGFPVTITEFSAAGIPILASDHCDIPEAVLDGVTGLIAHEGDLDDLTDKLEYMINNPELWPGYGRAGRMHVEKEYNIDVQVGRLEDIYDELLSL